MTFYQAYASINNVMENKNEMTTNNNITAAEIETDAEQIELKQIADNFQSLIDKAAEEEAFDDNTDFDDRLNLINAISQDSQNN